jgi:AraC-like DNA-binding protein
MSLKLSDTDWSELWQEEESMAINLLSLPQQIWKFSGPLGQGIEQHIPFQTGLHLVVCDYELWKDITLSSEHCYQTYPSNPCISFVVSGTVRTIHHGLTDYSFEVSGKNYLEFVPEGRETEDWSAGERIIKVRISLQTEALRDISRESNPVLPKELRLLVENQEMLPCYRLATSTPDMDGVLQQILNCPYQGWMRQFYLEGKTLELLVLWLAQATERDKLPDSCELSLSDIERVHQAREFLMQHLDAPPSLLELARKVGLNDYKLKRGFRQLYGTTVFGYLHTQRMEKARRLLANRQMKITDVAHAVGYASLPSFSLAFRKQFGVSPRAYWA